MTTYGALMFFSRCRMSSRLTYQDQEVDRKKEEDRIKKNDPKKAEQLERLGMGIGARGFVLGFSWFELEQWAIKMVVKWTFGRHEHGRCYIAGKLAIRSCQI